jgi:hypothetical protein
MSLRELKIEIGNLQREAAELEDAKKFKMLQFEAMVCSKDFSNFETMNAEIEQLLDSLRAKRARICVIETEIERWRPHRAIEEKLKAIQVEEARLFEKSNSVADYEERTERGAAVLKGLYNDLIDLEPHNELLWSRRIKRLLVLPKIAPDSVRVCDILPHETHATRQRKLELHFVNRDTSMKKLLRIHITIHTRRAQEMADAGGDITFPLMDSVYGMGKTTFSWKYLAMVARFVKAIKKEFEQGPKPLLGHDLEDSVAMYVEDILFPRPKNRIPEVHRVPDKHISTVLNELASAHTLYINCGKNSLLDRVTRDSNLMISVRQALEKQWGVIVGGGVTWADCFNDYIKKPVFLVFDEIGMAFRSADLNKSRDEFLDFVTCYCTPLSWASGVHYLLSGRGEFLSNVGIRADNQSSVQLGASPGSFDRVILNPIRRKYIAEIVEKTTIDEEKVSKILVDGHPEMTIEEIINNLYIRTAGHPRSLLASITAGNLIEAGDYSETLLTEVGLAVTQYRKEIQLMFENRRVPCDLTKQFQLHRITEISFEYLASRIFAGYNDTPEATELFFAPAVESYLMRVFLPFSDFVLDQKYLITNRYLDKSRIFEALLLKWFEAMGTSQDIIAHSWNGFCPDTSLLKNVILRVGSEKTVDGLRILSPGDSSSGPTTISVMELSADIKKYLTDNSVNIYFPAPKSSSPDIILIQPQEGRSDDFLVGIQAKCYSGGTIGAAVCEGEAKKFYTILERTRSVRRKKKLNGVLIMCATCGYTQSDFVELTSTTKSIVWDRKPKEWKNFEIIIINLSTPSMRKEFFGLALGVVGASSTSPPPNGDIVFDMIEQIINYK